MYTYLVSGSLEIIGGFVTCGLLIIPATSPCSLRWNCNIAMKFFINQRLLITITNLKGNSSLPYRETFAILICKWEDRHDRRCYTYMIKFWIPSDNSSLKIEEVSAHRQPVIRLINALEIHLNWDKLSLSIIYIMEPWNIWRLRPKIHIQPQKMDGQGDRQIY